MHYKADFHTCTQDSENAFWLLFSGDELLVKGHEGNYYIPSTHDMSMLHILQTPTCNTAFV